MHLLPTTLAAVADIAEVRENTRYAVTGVHLEVKEDNTYRVDATDTKFLLRVTGECTGKAEEYPMSPALEAAPNSHFKGLIPSQTWRKAFADASKLTKRVTNPILQSVAVKLGATEATFGMTNLESSPVETTRLAEGRFPPVDQFIPKRQRFAFSVDGARLAKLMKAMTSVCPGENEGRIDFYLAAGAGQGTADRIILKRSNTTTEALGLIVPLVGGDEIKGGDPIVMGKPAKSEAVAVLAVDEVEYTEETIRWMKNDEKILREERAAAQKLADDRLNRIGILEDELTELKQERNGDAGTRRILEQEIDRLAPLREEALQLRAEVALLRSKCKLDDAIRGLNPVTVVPAPVLVPGLTRAERIAALKTAA